jgi:hypothetical protein
MCICTHTDTHTHTKKQKYIHIHAGTHASSHKEAQQLQEIGIYLSMGHVLASKTTAPVVNDTMLTPEIEQENNLIVVGGTRFNSAAQRLLDASPTRGENTAKFPGNQGENAGKDSIWLTIGPCDVSGEGYAAVLTQPRLVDAHENSREKVRLDVHLAGVDLDAMIDAVRFSFAANQALTR